MSILQIRLVGRMWRIYCGAKVVAFAADYQFACTRFDEIKAEFARQQAAGASA